MSQGANLDAVGGSLAAALSVIFFYPLEVARVYLQTSRASNSEDETFGKQAHDLMVRAIRGFTERGVALRVIHTVLTSFIYYRIYALLSRRGGKKRSLVSNLISSNFAAMLTVILAMPLEMSVLNSQVADQRERSEEDREEEGRVRSVRETLGHWYQGLTPALLLCLNPMIHYSIYDWLKLEVLNKKNDARIGGEGARDGVRHQRSRSAGVWVENRNPIINRNKLTYDDLDDHQLGTGEAFLVGIIAKAAATIITFPLLRAKVLMMTSTDVRDTLADKEGDKQKAGKGMSHVSTFGQSLNEEEETEDEDGEDGGAAGSDRTKRLKTRKRSKSISEFLRRSDAGKLLETLMLLFRVQGLSGLYVGVLIHLVHTTLRGAVSMTLKERLVQLLRQHARR